MTTGVPVAKGIKNQKILEVVKACEEMKPILVYFYKPLNPLAGGKKKDREVSACTALAAGLWKQWVITELAKEFVCIRVNKQNADPKLLRAHGVVRAPVIKIVDFNLKKIYFSASPKVKHKVLAKVMNRARTKVEKAIKKLASSGGDSALVEKARARVQVLDQREFCDKGLTALAVRNWSRAEKEFNKGIAIEQDSEWKKQCKTGLIEIEAGKLYVKAERLEKGRRWADCKETCEKIVNEYKEADYFVTLTRTLLGKVAKKLKKLKKKKR